MKHFSSVKFLFSLGLIIISVLSAKNSTHISSYFYEDSSEKYSFSAQFSISTPENLSESFAISGISEPDGYLLFKTSNLSSALNEINYTDFATIFSGIDEKWWGIDAFSNDIYEIFDKNLVDSVRGFLENLEVYAKTDENDLKITHEEEGIFLNASIKISTIASDSVEYPTEYADFSEFFITKFENSQN